MPVFGRFDDLDGTFVTTLHRFCCFVWTQKHEKWIKIFTINLVNHNQWANKCIFCSGSRDFVIRSEYSLSSITIWSIENESCLTKRIIQPNCPKNERNQLKFLFYNDLLFHPNGRKMYIHNRSTIYELDCLNSTLRLIKGVEGYNFTVVCYKHESYGLYYTNYGLCYTKENYIYAYYENQTDKSKVQNKRKTSTSKRILLAPKTSQDEFEFFPYSTYLIDRFGRFVLQCESGHLNIYKIPNV